MPDAADKITDFHNKKSEVSLGEKNEYRLIAREEDAEFLRVDILGRAASCSWSPASKSGG